MTQMMFPVIGWVLCELFGWIQLISAVFPSTIQALFAVAPIISETAMEFSAVVASTATTVSMKSLRSIASTATQMSKKALLPLMAALLKVLSFIANYLNAVMTVLSNGMLRINHWAARLNASIREPSSYHHQSDESTLAVIFEALVLLKNVYKALLCGVLYYAFFAFFGTIYLVKTWWPRLVPPTVDFITCVLLWFLDLAYDAMYLVQVCWFRCFPPPMVEEDDTSLDSRHRE